MAPFSIKCGDPRTAEMEWFADIGAAQRNGRLVTLAL